MSWYVESILKSSYTIRSSIAEMPELIYRPISIVSMDNFDTHPSYSFEFDSDSYNDLLIIESTINELCDNGQISESELLIIYLVGDGSSFSAIESKIDLARVTITKIFTEVCDRISYTLGGIFTDDGYLDYMKNKYNLTDEQIDKAREYIKSKYRYANRRQ